MHPMDDHLVGYLLDALDEGLREEVESYLSQEPAASQKLDHLREALRPLEADRANPAPPPGLVEATLARVAAARPRARPLPASPRVPAALSGPSSWWRRADVLVASV